IEFENQKDCEQAYYKMQDVLIDDCRIHVDFSQSVSKLSEHWRDKENAKRLSRGPGFGGIKELEKRRQYRAEDTDRREDRRYGMVFDKADSRRTDGDRDQDARRWHSRSRSPRREGRDYHDSGEWRRRSPKRDSKEYHDRDGHGRRDRSRDRYRDNHRRNRDDDSYDKWRR